MTYRDPADAAPSGLIDSRALAACVEQLEAESARAQDEVERRRETRLQQARAKADRKATRVSIQVDHDGALLSLSNQSTAKAALIGSSVFLLVVLTFSVWAILSLSAEVMIFTTMMSLVVAVLPMMSIWHTSRNRRPLHLYAARNGFFTLYRRTPERPMAVGRIAHLEFDVRYEGEGLKRMMPKYAGGALLGDVYCDELTPRDMAAIEDFAQSTGIEVR